MCTVFDLPNVTIPKPDNWSSKKNNAPCQNPDCPEQESRFHDPDNTSGQGYGMAYSRGHDNGDGTITLQYSGLCLICSNDAVADLNMVDIDYR